jgi:hypothetical protein
MSKHTVRVAITAMKINKDRVHAPESLTIAERTVGSDNLALALIEAKDMVQRTPGYKPDTHRVRQTYEGKSHVLIAEGETTTSFDEVEKLLNAAPLNFTVDEAAEEKKD